VDEKKPSPETNGDTPLVEPEKLSTGPADPDEVDTERILRETGTIPVAAENSTVPRSSPHHASEAAESQLPPTGPSDTPSTTPVESEKKSWNVLAIAAFIVGLTLSPLAMVFGYLALGQLRRSEQAGEKLALAAIALGWAWTIVFAVLGIVAGVIWFQL
jgi:hypothetical protein